MLKQIFKINYINHLKLKFYLIFNINRIIKMKYLINIVTIHKEYKNKYLTFHFLKSQKKFYKFILNVE